MEWHKDPFTGQQNLFERDILSGDLTRPIPGGRERISELLGKENKTTELDPRVFEPARPIGGIAQTGLRKWGEFTHRKGTPENQFVHIDPETGEEAVYEMPMTAEEAAEGISDAGNGHYSVKTNEKGDRCFKVWVEE